MRVRFLGQGLREEGISAGAMLIESFQNAPFTKFTAFVAFASVAGIEQLTESIKLSKAHIIDWKVFVGIDSKGTSKEALELLLGLDINTHIYHTCKKSLSDK